MQLFQLAFFGQGDVQRDSVVNLAEIGDDNQHSQQNGGNTGKQKLHHFDDMSMFDEGIFFVLLRVPAGIVEIRIDIFLTGQVLCYSQF